MLPRAKISKSHILLGFLIIRSLSVCAQLEFKFPDYGQIAFQKPTLMGGLERKRAIAVGAPVRYNRYFVGQQYGEIGQWSFGFNNLTESPVDVRISRSSKGVDTLLRSYKLNFFNLEFGSVIARNASWKIEVPLALGLGFNTTIDEVPGNEKLTKTTKLVSIWDAGIQGTWYYREWVGLKGGLGIRVIPGKQSFALYTGPNYQFGIAFFPLKLYRILSSDH